MAEQKFESIHGVRICNNGKLCVHSRVCVTRSAAFKPGVSGGDWIDADAAKSRDELISTITQCPSGALTYETTDGSQGETAPPFNTIAVMENGPLVFRGDLRIQGEEESRFRATLCRCGHSANKPNCDLSHAREKFHATGEPDIVASEPLEKHDGLLKITWKEGGPLEVRGNVEVIAGSTGHTIARSKDGEVLRLCRCGLSGNKPFCDGSHEREGFEK